MAQLGSVVEGMELGDPGGSGRFGEYGGRYVPESLVPAFAARVPEAIWVGWPETPAGGLALEGLHLFRDRMERAAAVTVGLGLLVSLTIEVSQSFLPSRDSGTTDLFTNTLGTWIGVVAYRHPLVQTVMARVIWPFS